MKQLGEKAGTAKITQHGFHRFFPLFLDHLRNKEITMLEIGTEENKSLAMWEEYFPKARIYGIDIGNELKYERGEIFKGDQSDIPFLEESTKKIGKKLDLIIDDGSHVPEHQILTFNYLFENVLKEGGIYIIEDIETSYWTKGALYTNIIKKGYKHKQSAIEIFKDLIDKLNDEFVKDESVFDESPVKESNRNEIKLISFQHNSIIILKKSEEDREFENRDYRFSRFL